MGACSSRQKVVAEAPSTVAAAPLPSDANVLAAEGLRPLLDASGVKGANGTTALATAATVAADANSASSNSHPVLICPPDEVERLEAVRALNLLGLPPQPRFNSITKLMAHVFDVPLAAVGLLDEQNHLLGCAGPFQCDGTRAGSFCDWALASDTPTLVVVPDARQDSRFKSLPPVMAEPGIRFYAGAPLISSNGHRYGTLCVLDFKPRSFPPEQLAILAHFSEICVREMEKDVAPQLAQQKHLLRALDCFDEGILLADLSTPGWQILFSNDALRTAAGVPRMASSGSGASGGDGGDAERSQAALKFWGLFGDVPGAHEESYQAGAAAAQAGKPFKLRVRPLANLAQHSVLTLHFKPGDIDGLRADVPHIGVPAIASSASDDDMAATPDGGTAPNGSSSSKPGGGGSMAHLSPFAAFQVQAAAERALDRQLGAGRPLYFFAVLERQQAQPPSQPQLQLTASHSRPLGSAALTDALPPTPGDHISQGGSGLHATLSARTENELVPAFYATRPEVMEEVELGPLVGTGAKGRCYRGSWQGGRVCVKIVDCPVQPSALHHGAGNGCGGTSGGSPSGAAASPAAATLAVPPPHASATYASIGAQGRGEEEAEAARVEALLARCLSHPHIVTTYAHGVSTQQVPGTGNWRQQVWIVQEFCSKGSLLDAIDKGVLQLPDGSPNLPAILATAREIAGALLHLHSHGVIHGDLTPSNVLLASSSKDARRWVCKVSDFGLAAIFDKDTTEVKRRGFGTLTHMPRELVLCGTLSKAADVYSFGIILYELYTGRRAWLGMGFHAILSALSAGKQPFAIPPGCHPGIASLLHRCLHVDPAQRPNFGTILREVQELQRGQQ